jgi:hypothetical protein
VAISNVAIHEAGHCIVAIKCGLKVNRVYISEDTGRAEIEHSALSYIDDRFNVKVRNGVLIRPNSTKDFPRGILGVARMPYEEEKRKLIDVHLAGWTAEELIFLKNRRDLISRLMNKVYNVEDQDLLDLYGPSMIRRAEQDIQTICDICGWQDYKTLLPKYVIFESLSATFKFSGPILFKHLPGYDYLTFGKEEQDKLYPFAKAIIWRKEDLKNDYFSERHDIKALIALAKKISKKKELSGSEIINILR